MGDTWLVRRQREYWDYMREAREHMNLTTLTHVTAGAIYLARMFTRFGEGHPRRLERAVNASVALAKSVDEALKKRGGEHK